MRNNLFYCSKKNSMACPQPPRTFGKTISPFFFFLMSFSFSFTSPLPDFRWLEASAARRSIFEAHLCRDIFFYNSILWMFLLFHSFCVWSFLLPQAFFFSQAQILRHTFNFRPCLYCSLFVLVVWDSFSTSLLLVLLSLLGWGVVLLSFFLCLVPIPELLAAGIVWMLPARNFKMLLLFWFMWREFPGMLPHWSRWLSLTVEERAKICVMLTSHHRSVLQKCRSPPYRPAAFITIWTDKASTVVSKDKVPALSKLMRLSCVRDNFTSKGILLTLWPAVFPPANRTKFSGYLIILLFTPLLCKNLKWIGSLLRSLL